MMDVDLLIFCFLKSIVFFITQLWLIAHVAGVSVFMLTSTLTSYSSDLRPTPMYLYCPSFSFVQTTSDCGPKTKESEQQKK